MTTSANNPDPESPPSRTFVPEIEARRYALDGAATWADVTTERAAVWHAPYGLAEDWDLNIEDVWIDGPHGPIPARVYSPEADRTGRPCLLWCHGGAFMGGDLDMPEAHEVSRGIAGRADAVVVSVAYRLCPRPLGWPGTSQPNPGDIPGVRFPIPHDYVMAAYRWCP